MAVELNADLAKFSAFVAGLGPNGDENTAAQLGEDGAVLVATKTAGRFGRALNVTTGASNARYENNRVRAQFISALTAQFGGRLADIPDSVKEVLRLKDFGMTSVKGEAGTYDFDSGKPLTARRIAQVLTAVQEELKGANETAKKMMDHVAPAIREKYTAEVGGATGLSVEDLASRIVKAAQSDPSSIVNDMMEERDGASDVLRGILWKLGTLQKVLANSGAPAPSREAWQKVADRLIRDVVKDGYQEERGRYAPQNAERLLMEITDNLYNREAALTMTFDNVETLCKVLTKTARELVERIPEGGDLERYCVNIFGSFVEAYVPVNNALALTFPKHPDASRHVGLKDIGEGSPFMRGTELAKCRQRELGLEGVEPGDETPVVDIGKDILRAGPNGRRVKIGNGPVLNVTERSKEPGMGTVKAVRELVSAIRDYLQEGMTDEEKLATKAQLNVVCRGISQYSQNIMSAFNRNFVRGGVFAVEKGADGKVLLHFTSDVLEKRSEDGTRMENASYTYEIDRDGTNRLAAFSFDSKLESNGEEI